MKKTFIALLISLTAGAQNGSIEGYISSGYLELHYLSEAEMRQKAVGLHESKPLLLQGINTKSLKRTTMSTPFKPENVMKDHGDVLIYSLAEADFYELVKEEVSKEGYDLYGYDLCNFELGEKQEGKQEVFFKLVHWSTASSSSVGYRRMQFVMKLEPKIWDLEETYAGEVHEELRNKISEFALGLHGEHPRLKRGQTVTFMGGYNNDIKMKSRINGFDSDGGVYVFWDCYWYPIKDEVSRLIQIVE